MAGIRSIPSQMNSYYRSLSSLELKLSKEAFEIQWKAKLKELCKDYGANLQSQPIASWLFNKPKLLPEVDLGTSKFLI